MNIVEGHKGFLGISILVPYEKHGQILIAPVAKSNSHKQRGGKHRQAR